jgi:hypothetical protein
MNADKPSASTSASISVPKDANQDTLMTYANESTQDPTQASASVAHELPVSARQDSRETSGADSREKSGAEKIRSGDDFVAVDVEVCEVPDWEDLSDSEDVEKATGRWRYFGLEADLQEWK